MSGILFGSGEDDEQSTGYIDAGDITGIFCDDGEMIGLTKRQTSELVICAVTCENVESKCSKRQGGIQQVAQCWCLY